MSEGPEYDPEKTTHEQLLERKAPAGDVIQLYHGTDDLSAEQIKTKGPKRLCRPFHDFAMGRDAAFYMTTSRETAVLFARERALNLPGSKPAVVGITMQRNKVDLYEFDVKKVDVWQKVMIRGGGPSSRCDADEVKFRSSWTIIVPRHGKRTDRSM